MFKGPTGPQSGRTGRSRAEELNDPNNFDDGPKYDPKAGVPASMPAAQEYNPRPMKPAGDGKPIDVETPFVITQK